MSEPGYDSDEWQAKRHGNSAQPIYQPQGIFPTYHPPQLDPMGETQDILKLGVKMKD